MSQTVPAVDPQLRRREMPGLTGKNVLITGGSSALKTSRLQGNDRRARGAIRSPRSLAVQTNRSILGRCGDRDGGSFDRLVWL